MPQVLTVKFSLTSELWGNRSVGSELWRMYAGTNAEEACTFYFQMRIWLLYLTSLACEILRYDWTNLRARRVSHDVNIGDGNSKPQIRIPEKCWDDKNCMGYHQEWCSSFFCKEKVMDGLDVGNHYVRDGESF